VVKAGEQSRVEEDEGSVGKAGEQSRVEEDAGMI
jgi:hypothetical protein